MRDFNFHHYVKDKDGNIEMEIFANGNKFTVHFPRYEGANNNRFRFNTCFAEMRDYQVGMLIFAYSEQEFYRFQDCYEKARKKQIPDWMAQFQQDPIENIK